MLQNGRWFYTCNLREETDIYLSFPLWNQITTNFEICDTYNKSKNPLRGHRTDPVDTDTDIQEGTTLQWNQWPCSAVTSLQVCDLSEWCLYGVHLSGILAPSDSSFAMVTNQGLYIDFFSNQKLHFSHY